MFSKQAANSLVTETSQYFVVLCRNVCSAILEKCLIINVLRLILVILFFIAFLNITYTARHTWATMAYYCEVHPGVISEAMGHSSITVTETYLKPFKNKKIDEANVAVISSLKKVYSVGKLLN